MVLTCPCGWFINEGNERVVAKQLLAKHAATEHGVDSVARALGFTVERDPAGVFTGLRKSQP